MLSPSNIKKLKSSFKWSVKNWMTEHLKQRLKVTVKKKSRGDLFYYVERDYDRLTLTLFTKVYLPPERFILSLTFAGRYAQREASIRIIEDDIIKYRFTYRFHGQVTEKVINDWIIKIIDYYIKLKKEN